MSKSSSSSSSQHPHTHAQHDRQALFKMGFKISSVQMHLAILLVIKKSGFGSRTRKESRLVVKRALENAFVFNRSR